MTVTSVQTILPGRYAINATEKRAEKPPPQTYGVQDFPFKGYQPPQPDGFEQSRARPDTSAIVIDNGKCANMDLANSKLITRYAQAPTSSRQVGPLIRNLASSSLPL